MARKKKVIGIAVAVLIGAAVTVAWIEPCWLYKSIHSGKTDTSLRGFVSGTLEGQWFGFMDRETVLFDYRASGGYLCLGEAESTRIYRVELGETNLLAAMLHLRDPNGERRNLIVSIASRGEHLTLEDTDDEWPRVELRRIREWDIETDVFILQRKIERARSEDARIGPH